MPLFKSSGLISQPNAQQYLHIAGFVLTALIHFLDVSTPSEMIPKHLLIISRSSSKTVYNVTFTI